MPRFTDEQVEAAMAHLQDWLPLGATWKAPTLSGHPMGPDSPFGKACIERLREDVVAALTAAADAAPAVDTTEFEASLREFGARSRLAHGGYLAGNKERENEFKALAEKTFSRLLDMFREAAR